jgi:hypothetical protein
MQRLVICQRSIFVFASISVGGFKSSSNYIYKIFNLKKNIRGSLLALGLDSPSLLGTTSSLLLCNPPASSYHFTSLHSSRTFSESATTTVKTPSSLLGIEPGPPAWESSTLPSEPLDVRKNTSIFWTSIVNVHAHCMLHSYPFSFISKI